MDDIDFEQCRECYYNRDANWILNGINVCCNKEVIRLYNIDKGSSSLLNGIYISESIITSINKYLGGDSSECHYYKNEIDIKLNELNL